MNKIGTLLTLGALSGMSALGLSVDIEQGAYRGGSGGEFVAVTSPSYLGAYDSKAIQTVTSNSGASVQGFGTFCLERGERVAFDTTYDGVINQRAFSGGIDKHDPVGAGPAGDPISLATAYLYSQFAEGTLAGYNYSPTAARRISSGLLQDAIWYFEDELSLKDPTANPFIDLAIDLFGEDAAFAASNGKYGVSAINLTYNGQKRQDVLIYDPPTSLPDAGATLIMLGGGLLGLFSLRRRQA